MKRTTKIIATILIVAGTSTAVFAYGKHGSWKMSPDEKVEFITDRVSDKLALDSQQQQVFTDLAETVMQIIVEAKANKAEQVAEIQQLLSEPYFNQSRALEIVQQKTQLVNDKAPQVIASLAGFLDSLTAEQKASLGDFMENHRNHHGRNHDH
jgi:Spy/CpxP family protein refolding chaperone